MQHLLLAGGAVVVLLVLVLWRRESGKAGASKRAHDAAQKREPPVVRPKLFFGWRWSRYFPCNNLLRSILCGYGRLICAGELRTIPYWTG